MTPSDFDALAATLALDDRPLAVGCTIFPGTLVSGREAPPRPAPPSLAPVAPQAFELVSVLGRGGMGVVWTATQRALDRAVAVKRLGEPPFGARETSALLAEARTTGALEHPAIVPVHDLARADDGSPLLVMKRVEGATLGELVTDPEHAAWGELERRHGDRLAALVDVLMRVCDALEFAHRRGYVHRDVKCDNIMVGAFGEVYLLDWGVALRVAHASDTVEIVGTPSSMSPEMARGDARAIDARSDVYLLGATLHQVLTGRPRHQGTTLHAVLLAAFLSEPPAGMPGVADELASLVRRATAGDPAARPQSAARFREELAAFLQHRASQRIADEAIARLDALEREDPAALTSSPSSRALTEVRFGLTQAIREWPENTRAMAGLERALVACVRAELARDSPGTAASVVAEMQAPPTDLAAEVRAAERQAAERVSLAAAAIDEAAERDAGRSAPVRRSMASVFVVATALLTVGAIAVGGPNPGEHIGYGTAFVLDLGFLTISLVLLYLTRARTFVNRWSRDAVGLFLVAAVGTSLSHAIGWIRHDDIALRGDSPTQILFAVLFAIGSMLLSRRLVVAALLACAAAFVSAVWPAVSLWASAITVTTGAVLLAQTSDQARRAIRSR